LLRVREIFSKTILSRSRIYGVDYALNPYLGCQHGCVYCYARFMAKGVHRGEEWGSFVDVKVNALKLLASEVRRKPKGVVLLSSVTDAYQPLERRYEITRGCLRLLVEHGFPVTILTKSNLVLRDVDILGRGDSEVGLTITTMEEGVKKGFEPNSPTVKERLEALWTLHDEGVKTYAFLGPMLPYLSEIRLGELLDKLCEVCVNHVIFDRLNIKAGNWLPIRRALERHFPEMVKKFEFVLFSPWGEQYYRNLKARLSRMCLERGLKYVFCY